MGPAEELKNCIPVSDSCNFHSIYNCVGKRCENWLARIIYRGQSLRVQLSVFVDAINNHNEIHFSLEKEDLEKISAIFPRSSLYMVCFLFSF